MGLTQVSTDGVKNDAINTAKINNGSIQSEDIADNQIITTKILDGAVSLAKLPHGDTNNNGKFLRANNGADPSFETVSIPAGTTINNNANNRVITGSGTANTLNGESNVTINSDGDLLVGRTTTIDTSECFGIKGPNGDHATFGITTDGTTNLGIIAFNDNDANFRGQIRYSHNGDVMQFQTAGAERINLSADGLKFNGDTAAANALNDYEEGTFTLAASAMGVTNTNCKYVKIGRLVYCTGTIDTGSSGNGALVAQFSGLPFAGQTGCEDGKQGGTVPDHNVGVTIFTALVSGSSMRIHNDTGSFVTQSVVDDKQMNFNITYYTT